MWRHSGFWRRRPPWGISLGREGAGFPIYPGSANARIIPEEQHLLAEEAKASRGAVTTRWYARGSSVIQKAKPDALCPPHRGAVGAHILKVKLPTDHSKQAQAKRAHDKVVVPTGTLTEWAPPTFGGHRIVIVSGGATKEKNESAFDEAHAIGDGGGFGSIIGGNSFQRPREHGLPFLETITEI